MPLKCTQVCHLCEQSLSLAAQSTKLLLLRVTFFFHLTEQCFGLVDRPSCILFSLTHSKAILTAELPLNGCLTSPVHVFASLSGAHNFLHTQYCTAVSDPWYVSHSCPVHATMGRCLYITCVMVHPGDVACFTIAGGGGFVLSGDTDGALQTWCAVDGQAICARPGAHSGGVACLAFIEPILVWLSFCCSNSQCSWYLSLKLQE